MSFEMEYDNHQIEMTQDHTWGLEILDLKCPYKSKLEDIHVLLRKSDSMDLSNFSVVMKLLQNITEVSGEAKSSELS